MYVTTTSVLNKGPPLGVMTQTASKTSKAAMIEMTRTNNMLGRSNGRVMLQKRCQREAPSTRATRGSTGQETIQLLIGGVGRGLGRLPALRDLLDHRHEDLVVDLCR